MNVPQLNGQSYTQNLYHEAKEVWKEGKKPQNLERGFARLRKPMNPLRIEKRQVGQMNAAETF